MLRAMPEMPSDMRSRHLDIVFEHSNRVARIVQNLQNFARPRAPVPQRVKLKDAIDETIAALGRRLDRVNIVVDIDAELMVFVDPEQNDLVWENLIISMANIMPASRTLFVGAEGVDNDAIQVRMMSEAGQLPDDLLNELRSPFLGGSFTLDPGRGLALAISWGIIQDHGGWMTAQNEPNGGASIEAYLPGENPKITGESRSELVRPRKVGWDVLVVDDDVLMAETVGWMVSAVGHRATLVHSAEEALIRLEHETFHVILTDHRLPGMDGETLLEYVHQQWPEMMVRTVLTSGLLHRPKDGQAYLQKPFSMEQLAALFAQIQ
jgi:CheY-like chemotaxis protein